MSIHAAVSRFCLVCLLVLSVPTFGGQIRRYTERKVKDVYIVDIKIKDEATIRRVAQDVATKYKGKIIDVYTEIFGGFAVQMSESAALAVSELPEVDTVSESPIGNVIEAPVERANTTLNWGLDRIDQRALPLDGWYSLEYPASDPIDASVRDTVAAGVVVVIGAGNSVRSACTRSPQRTGNPAFIQNNPDGYSAITVAASDRNDRVSYYGIVDGVAYGSNTGPCVDVFAPGGPGLVAQGYNSVDYDWQGTSAAAPFVAGLAALTLARFGNITPAMVESYIIQNSTKNIIRDNPDGASMLSSTPNNLAYQVLPGKRRACCS